MTMASACETLPVPGRFLVQGDHDNNQKLKKASKLLRSTESISFWGGIDPVTGLVVDVTHPLVGQSVTDSMLVLPSGRGSCTASQVLLELILNDKAPKAIVMRDLDGLAAVGAIVAEQVFKVAAIDILHVGEEGFQNLIESSKTYGTVSYNTGEILMGDTAVEVEERYRAIESECHHSAAVSFELTPKEQQMLDRCDNEATKIALQVVFRYAHMTSPRHIDTAGAVQGSQELMYRPVTSAHIDGCTYIGPGGLALAQRLVAAGGKVVVPTTLNSMSTDRRRWSALGVPSDYATNAIALGNAYLDLGCRHSFTCAPYLLCDVDGKKSQGTNDTFDFKSAHPRKGQDLVWGESNAVVYANSVWGARTEKYADYLDICCALAGIVPAAGVHLEENRRPTIVLDAGSIQELLLDDNDVVDWDAFFPVLGHLCGTLSDGKVPVVVGLEALAPRVTKEHLKAFCAAFGTTGTSPLVHIAGVTPEATNTDSTNKWTAECGANRVDITMEDLNATFATLDSNHQTTSSEADRDSVQLIALGNPHLSVQECETLSRMTSGQLKHPDVRIVACLSREIHARAEKAGYIQPLESFGMEFINDTCWCMLLDEPVIPSDPKARILTNSGKYAHYGPGLTSRTFRFGSTQACVNAAITGSYPGLTSPHSITNSAWLRRTSNRSYWSDTANVFSATRRFMKYMR